MDKLVIDIEDFEVWEIHGKEHYILRTNLGEMTLEELFKTIKEIIENSTKVRGKIELKFKRE